MNTNAKQAHANALAGQAQQYAEACEWLEACPFDDGQPFFETAGIPFEEWGQRMIESARIIGDAALLESIEAAITESEWGVFDGEPAFWRYISAWALGIAMGGK
jgi:hypothetical protein